METLHEEVMSLVDFTHKKYTEEQCNLLFAFYDLAKNFDKASEENQKVIANQTFEALNQNFSEVNKFDVSFKVLILSFIFYLRIRIFGLKKYNQNIRTLTKQLEALNKNFKQI